MSHFFPRQSVEWRLEEPPAFRRLSLSIVEMALLTGIVLRVLRALTFTHGRASWLFYGAAFVVGMVILLGMTTAYLANWTLRSWLWRAPLFALIETVGEMAHEPAPHRAAPRAGRGGARRVPRLAEHGVPRAAAERAVHLRLGRAARRRDHLRPAERDGAGGGGRTVVDNGVTQLAPFAVAPRAPSGRSRIYSGGI